MNLGTGIQNNANTPAINSQSTTAALPPPGYVNRWVLDKQAKKLYVDNGTALILVLDGSGGGGAQDLQSVTDNGNVTTNDIDVNNLFTNGGVNSSGVVSALGVALTGTGGTGFIAMPGNVPTSVGTPVSTAINFFAANGSSVGYKMSAGGVARFVFTNDGTSRVFQYPTINGTFALLSDLTTLVPYTGATANVNIGAFTFTADTIDCNTFNSATISTGTIFSSGALLVTLGTTLGGGVASGTVSSNGFYDLFNSSFKSRLTALTQTGINTWSMPDNTGTVALLSDIPAAGVPYIGATANVDLNIFSLTARSFVSGDGTGTPGAIFLWDNAGHVAQFTASTMGANQNFVNTSYGGTICTMVAPIDLIGVTAALTTTNIFTPSFNNGVFEWSVTITITSITAATVTSQLEYTNINGTLINQTMAFPGGATGIVGVGDFSFVPLGSITVQAASTIQMLTRITGGTAAVNVHGSLVQLR